MGAIAEVERAATQDACAHCGQFLTFMLGREAYAMSIQPIREIIEYCELTTVPMMPAFIRGVINLRGRVVPVVDLSARFLRGAMTAARRTCIVIVEVLSADEVSTQDIGVMVDAVNEVVEIPGSAIEPAPAFGNSIRHDFISGMAAREGRFVVVLDVGRVLSVREMASIGESLMAPAAPTALAVGA